MESKYLNPRAGKAIPQDGPHDLQDCPRVRQGQVCRVFVLMTGDTPGERQDPEKELAVAQERMRCFTLIRSCGGFACPGRPLYH